MSGDILQIELPIVRSGTDLEIRSRIGFVMYIEGGEWTPSRSIAKWLSLSRARQENVRCMMGYIVDLTVILDGISKTAAGGNVTENAALKVTDSHIRSGCRDSIHRDIRKFVDVAIKIPVPQKDLVLEKKDLVLEKITDLIGHYCSSSFRA